MRFSFSSFRSQRFDWISDTPVLLLTILISAYCFAGCSRPSFVNRSLNHVASLDAKISAPYSISVNDKAMVVWRFEH